MEQGTLGALWVVGLASLALAGCSKQEPGPARLAADAPITGEVLPTTRLTLGDPAVQRQLELTGELKALPFVVNWQNISGGPQTLEAFRAHALEGGSVGDTPPIHARFTGVDVKIIAVQVRTKPIYQLAVAPGVRVASIADLRAKRIAYSPGQAQGALILRVLARAGLAQDEVQLVQLISTEFKDALASHQVDVAPLGSTILLRYLNEYRSEGASAIPHGVEDSLGFFYVSADVLSDPQKAAALREYVKLRTRSQLWAYQHPEDWIRGYYVKDQGLTEEEGRYLVETTGGPEYPGDWSESIARTQQTIDLLAAATNQQRFDASELFDRRFERVGAEVASAAARLGQVTPEQVVGVAQP